MTAIPKLGVAALSLAIVCVLLAAMALAGNLPTAFDGVGAFSRVVLGAVGVAGSVLLFVRNPLWSRFLVAWSALQIPVIIVDPTGDMTNQGLHLGAQWTHQTMVNDVVTSMTGYGVNAVGVILLVWVLLVRRARRPQPS